MKESTRTQKLADQITELLDGATTHPEIRSQLPKLKPFFNKLSSIDFIALLSSDIPDPIYTLLWYHYGATMDKAINKCAIATPERMIELYPLWRQFADEADSYERKAGRPKSVKLTHIVVENSLPKLLQAVYEHKDCPEWLVSSIENYGQPKKINNAVLDLSAQPENLNINAEWLDLAKNISAILMNEQVPWLGAAMMDELQKVHPDLTHFTIENLNKILCQEVGDD